MGVSTVTAARILAGQQDKAFGEESELSFEQFPATALAKTYTFDLQTAESAGAMSAIMTGLKTRGASVALDQVPTRGQCQEAMTHHEPTLLEEAKDAGLAAGLVTTMRLTHAVPAATYAHVSDPDWEIDWRVPPQAKAQGCKDIARQLAEFDHLGGLDVVLGGGRAAFTGVDQEDPRDKKLHGLRADGRDLIAEWLTRNPGGDYVWSASALAGVQWKSFRGRLLGLFARDNLAYEADRLETGDDEPSLTEMTTAAIKALQRNTRGYVLVVDAGGIDRGHHAGNAYRALTDTVELARAVQAAQAATNVKDTLIVVTADHSHTLTLGGYPKRGNPILGLARGLDDAPLLDDQNQPYATLAYGNGPGVSQPPKEAPVLSDAVAKAADFRQPAGVPLPAGTHGGEDVPVYARGPGSQWVHGVLDQHALYWIMHAALGLPNAPDLRKAPSRLPKPPKLWPFGKKAAPAA
jgi:alkaline phosphatase